MKYNGLQDSAIYLATMNDQIVFWLIVLSSQMKTCGTWPELLIFFWTWRYVFPHFIPFFLSFFLFILLSEGHSF